MPNEPSPTAGDPGNRPTPTPNPAPAPSTQSRKITCEFCESVLYPSGELVHDLSAKAKKLRDARRELETVTESRDNLTEQLTNANAEIATLKTKIAELESRPAPAPAPSATQSGYRIPIKV